MYISKKNKYLIVRKILLFGISVLYSYCVYSQENTTNGFTPDVQLSYLYGSVKNPISIPNQGNAHYLQLSLLHQTGSQEQSLYALYKKPSIGATVLYGFLGSKDVLGKVIALYPTWQYMFNTSKNLGASIRIGSGFAYFTNPYDKISNQDNKLVGSHISNCTEISPNIWFKFAPTTYVQTGVSLMHFSNGHTAIPNIGLNDITFRLGVIYRPGSLVGVAMPIRVKPNNDTVWRKRIQLSVGRHELAYTTYPVDGPTYNIYKVGGYLTRQINRIHDFQLGLTMAFYDSYYTFIKYENYYSHFKPFMATQTTLHIGHEFLLQHFGILTEMGLKVLDPFYRSYFLADEIDFAYTSKSLLSARVGLTYYPFNGAFASKKLGIGMFIKTNFVQADYVDYSISYTF
jgi:hypothetical protein